MKDELLKSLLKSKQDKKKNVEGLIEEYLMDIEKRATKNIKELFSEVVNFVYRNYGEVSQKEIEEIFSLKIEKLGLVSMTSVDVLYKKIKFAPLVAADFEAIKALEKRLLWISNDSSKRTQDKLKEILTEAYKGKYTKDEFLDKLRTSFTRYSDLEPHKLKAAANWHLRQNQNIATALRANEFETKYVRVRAVIDGHTTNICRSMHGRLIPTAHVYAQAKGIIEAKNIKEAMSYTDPHSKGVWSKKLPKNIGLPPYHFGCRTRIEEVPDALLDELDIDEFGRGYKFKEGNYNLKRNKHAKKKKERDYDRLIRETMQSIAYEGLHQDEKGKRVIYGNNGCVVFMDKNGLIDTLFKPDTKHAYYDKWAISTHYDWLEEKMKGIKKWLNIFSW